MNGDEPGQESKEAQQEHVHPEQEAARPDGTIPRDTGGCSFVLCLCDQL